MKIKFEILRLFAIVFLIAGGAYVLYALLSPPVLLSDDQAVVRDYLGPPEQFALTYLPRGTKNEPQLARSEVWFYPSQGKKINFLAGELMSVEEIPVKENNVTKTDLKPENFNAHMDYNKIKRMLDYLNIERLELPGFFDEQIETYSTDDAVFILEYGTLSYVQTFAECLEGKCKDEKELDSLYETTTY